MHLAARTRGAAVASDGMRERAAALGQAGWWSRLGERARGEGASCARALRARAAAIRCASARTSQAGGVHAAGAGRRSVLHYAIWRTLL
jgi:hypothetical protein